MTTTTYPNGQVLTSSALTVDQINVLLQSLTCGMLGLPLPTPSKPSGYSDVRVDWPTQGQPFVATPAQDGCFLACVQQETPYNKVRNKTLSGAGPVTETWTYTRGWRTSWTLYGPNSYDRARQIWSALFMDYFNDQLNLANLFPVSDPAEPTRTPENFNAQWWERTDFSIEMYENVTETIDDSKVTSLEIKLYDAEVSKTGPAADVIVAAT